MAPKPSSTTEAAKAQAAANLPSAPQKIEPTSLLPTSVARTYSHVYPVLVLTLFVGSFQALVRDPVATLSALLPPVAALQAAYCVLCLPPHQTAGLQQQSGNGSAGGGSARKKGARGGSLMSKIIVRARPQSNKPFNPPPPNPAHTLAQNEQTS